MSELTSPGKVTAASGSSNFTGSSMQAKSNEARNINAKNAENSAKNPARNAQGDSQGDYFKAANPNVRPTPPEIAPSAKTATMNQAAFKGLNSNPQDVPNIYANAGFNARGLLENFMSRFVNIMDKISAVFGEREKDIRDKLSDTTKNLEMKIYNFLGRVDTSMEQKDHSSQKQTRDDEQQDSEEEEE